MKSSARQTKTVTDLWIRNCPEYLQGEFIKLASAHGLTLGQAYLMLLSWAVNQGTLFPDASAK